MRRSCPVRGLLTPHRGLARGDRGDGCATSMAGTSVLSLFFLGLSAAYDAALQPLGDGIRGGKLVPIEIELGPWGSERHLR